MLAPSNFIGKGTKAMPTLNNEEKESFSNEPSLEYVSIGCNRAPHALEWGRNGLVAFGACNSVVIYDPQVNHHGEMNIMFI